MSFDKLAGIAVYCMDYHDGQWSRLYRLQCRIGARLSDSAIAGIRRGCHDPSNEWEDARRVYRTLKRRKAQ